MTIDTPKQTPDIGRPDIGRNEPCPCGSGKKYKRCCGISAAPKLGTPKAMPDFSTMGAGGGLSPDQMDPAAMAQVAQMLQRLPKGQMQRLQSLMQQAMAGKDVSREAEAFERTLPVEFQNTLQAMKLPGMAGSSPDALAEPPGDVQPEGTEMTPEQARKLVEEAAQAGRISKEEASSLLERSPPQEDSEEEKSGGFSKLFRWGKK